MIRLKKGPDRIDEKRRNGEQRCERDGSAFLALENTFGGSVGLLIHKVILANFVRNVVSCGIFHFCRIQVYNPHVSKK